MGNKGADQAIKIGSDVIFGRIFAVIFLVFALLPVTKGHSPHIWAVAIALLLFVLSIFSPALLHPINILWTRFGLLLNLIMEPIIMTTIYCVAILPFGLLFKILKPDLLRIKRNPAAVSYWTPKENSGSSMKNQF